MPHETRQQLRGRAKRGSACLLSVTRVRETVGRGPDGRVGLANGLLSEALCAMPGLSRRRCRRAGRSRRAVGGEACATRRRRREHAVRFGCDADGLVVSSGDLSGNVDAEQRAERLGRIYATLSKVDEAMVRVRQRLPLFEEVCRVLVEEGRLRMAWVGEIGEDGWIAPVAHAGITEGYLDSIRISVLDVPEGQGPTGTAARELHHVFTTDIANDARMGPWRQAALAREYRSSAAFPLVIEDRCVAVLTAYSPEPGFFDEDEVALFDRMAADLSFALEAMAREERRREVVAELRASEERFRVAAESMLDSLAIISPVRDCGGEIIDFRLRHVNDAYCALMGLERERVVGHRLGELFPGFPGSERFEVYRRVAMTGELCRTDELHLPETWAGASLAARVFDTVIASMGEELVVSTRDVTERKRAEEELAETTGLLERTQQISKTGGWEYDLATGNLTWTDEVYRIYGSDRRYGPVELERAMSAFDPESAPIIREARDRLVADGKPCDLEVGLIRADGQRIWVRVVGEAVIESGHVVRVRGIIADVNDRRLVEEELRTLNVELEQRVAARTTELERINHELESFAYSVSHDLRAPLRAVDGFSKVLLDDYADKLGGDGRHYLERVRAGAVRMGTLIDEILQLSRLSRRRFERVRVDLSLLASEVVAELNDAEPDRRGAVEIRDGLFAEADRELVRTVLQNLLANAYKFTSKTPDPDIRFGVVEQEGALVYYVADNGAGFDMAHAKRRLFRPFHRLHRESEFPGDGIGLATVARCVHRHGGEVWAEGAVNQGATFYFSLTPGAHPPASAPTGQGIIPSWQPSDGEQPE
ncbi:MAG: GAF domain-containing protein [Solirubrobacteraceae bacterium]